jgi:hypothetical protein
MVFRIDSSTLLVMGGASFSETLVSINLLAARFMLVSCLSYSSTLKMEMTCSSEMLIDFQQTTWLFIPEDTGLHNHRCENLIYYSLISKTTSLYRPLYCTQYFGTI